SKIPGKEAKVLTRIFLSLPLQFIHNIDVHGARVPINHYDNGQPHGHFRRSHSHDEKDENLSRRIAVMYGKGCKQQIYRVQHQFDRHQNNNRVPPGEHADHTHDKQGRAEPDIMFQRYRLYGLQCVFQILYHLSGQASLLPISTAPTMAVSNNTEASSNGSKNSLNNTIPRFSTNPMSVAVVPPAPDTSTVLRAPTSTSNNRPPETTPAILI